MKIFKENEAKLLEKNYTNYDNRNADIVGPT